MRVMIKFAFPIEAGNTAIRDGKVEKVFQGILEELKPEAAYFFPKAQNEWVFFVVDMKESSQVVEIAERFFFRPLMPRSKWSRLWRWKTSRKA